MNTVSRKIQTNNITTLTSVSQDTGASLAKIGGAGLVLTLLSMFIPVLGVGALSLVFVLVGLYMRFVR